MEHSDSVSGKHYALDPAHNCVLMVRPRGWHLPEKHLLYKQKPVAAALADAGFFLFHGASELKARGRGAYLYLPKIERWEEAALWDDVLAFAEKRLGVNEGEIKTTVLIETLPAVFQMHEILHALRSRAAGLNCGRWDYIFSYLKTFRAHPGRILPERNLVTMAAPFLRAYSRLLIQTCHKRGAHAMGGMAAFIPIKDDMDANEKAFAKVREDKTREARDGHDGTWVAHPGLIKTAREVFDRIMPNENQKEVFPPQTIAAADLLAPPEGEISAAGFDNNIQVAIRYIAAWLGGDGAAPIFNLMEDAATAEIARAQLWQWIKYPKGVLSSGENISEQMFMSRLAAAREQIAAEYQGRPPAEHLDAAAGLLSELVLADELADFLTLAAYPRLL
jgi:malate synthase